MTIDEGPKDPENEHILNKSRYRPPVLSRKLESGAQNMNEITDHKIWFEITDHIMILLFSKIRLINFQIILMNVIVFIKMK